MTMSPVNVHDPRVLARYPRFGHARPWNITVSAGHCLFLPSWWWHEVSSTPGAHGYVMSINVWYLGLYRKEFPCADCRPTVNLHQYAPMLRSEHHATLTQHRDHDL